MDAYLFPALWGAAGLVLLIVGGEVLVRGASALAAALRISPLVIGLTVVAFGTSAPELAVSVQSAVSGQPDLAVGNVVGSNIANVLLILGASACVTPLVVASQLIRFDVPLMIAASFAVLALGWDGTIGRWDGVGLFTALLVYTAWLIRQSRKEPPEVSSEFAEQLPSGANETTRRFLVQAGLIVGGLALLALGSRWLVSGAVDIARLLGASELIIGLTIVAVGTSLPEVVTSIMASVRGQRDIAVGNVVGSNLFNILCVLGLSSVVAPDGIGISNEALQFDIPVMLAVAVACLPIFFTGNLIARWEGVLFLGYYAAYTGYLVLVAVEASVTETFTSVMLVFVIPLTCITLVIGLVRSLRRRAAGEQQG